MNKDNETGFISVAFIIAVVLALVIVLGAWRFYRQKETTTPLTKEKIVIANVGEYSIFNLIAHEKGLFSQNGLEAEVNEYTSGPSGVADLLAGKADFAIAADFVGVSHIFNHQEIRILSQASEHDVFSIVGRKDRGIRAPEDIKGKRIGVTKNGAGEFFLGRFLIFNDLDLSDITIVDLQQPDLIKQIENGQLDAIVIFEPHTYNFKNDPANKFTIFSAQGQEKTRAIVYTMADTIQARPDVVKRYLRSLTEAESYFKAHPEDAKAILAKKMNYEADYTNYLWPKIDFGLSLPQELLLTMENEARYAIDKGITKERTMPNYLNFIYFDSLMEVKPDAVTIVH